MHNGLDKCKERAMKIAGSDSKGGYMNEDMTDEKGMYEDEKRMYSEETRMEMAKEGMALPDGSYPIKDKADLENAIQAYGRAKNKEKAKKHIMKRAKELGLEDMIPEKWMDGEKSVEETITMELAEFESLQEEIKSLRVVLD